MPRYPSLQAHPSRSVARSRPLSKDHRRERRLLRAAVRHGLTDQLGPPRASRRRAAAVAPRHLHVLRRWRFHILFNMLALWMFGTELERDVGTRYFVSSTSSPDRRRFRLWSSRCRRSLAQSLLDQHHRGQEPSTACCWPTGCTSSGPTDPALLVFPAGSIRRDDRGAIAFYASIGIASRSPTPRTWSLLVGYVY